jgi:hypothetical protein
MDRVVKRGNEIGWSGDELEGGGLRFDFFPDWFQFARL